jgi:hypothetical protein
MMVKATMVTPMMKQRIRLLRSVLGVLLLLSVTESFGTIRKQLRHHQRSRLQFSTYHDNGTTELLEALLYEADMRPLRIRQREYAYQRRRLGEQLRLNKMSLHSQREYAYQRRRLGEQLRLNQKQLKEEIRLERSREETTKQTDRVEVKSAMQPTTVANRPDDMHVQLEILRHKVDMAVQLPPANTKTVSIYNETATGTSKSLLEMISDTHLPMPPREDAALMSLCLAPLAHLTSSIFLLVTSAFYAIMSVLDALWNDDTVMTCMVEAGHVVRSCGSHVWQSFTSKRKDHFFSTMMDSSKTFLFSLWYVTKCIVVRATYSKYANQCFDAGTGALRYGVYAMRSTNVLWKRFIESAGGSKEIKMVQMTTGAKSPTKKWSRKLHLSRVLSSIGSARAKQRFREQNLQIEQRRMSLEREYLDKLRLLNQDRILLERERRSLEEERLELICESVNLLAWCSAMASSGSNAKVDPDEKGWSSWWKTWG